MKKLHDYLDYKKILIKGKDGRTAVGVPVSVLYADENYERNEDLIDVETKDGEFHGFYESDIERIEVIE